MTPGRLLYILRRRFKLGVRHWFAEKVIWKQILNWRPNGFWPFSPVPLHLLTNSNDWKMALWMLASFHETTQRRWLITLHEDGSLMEEDLENFWRIFPEIRIVRPKDAELRMARVLSNYPRCRDYRTRMPHALKCFDIPEFCEEYKYLMLDPDVLFFRSPAEILNWAEDSNMRGCWFNRDFQEPSPISPAQAVADLGVPLWPCVNTGLCLLERQTVKNLDAMEEWLGHPALQNPKMQWRVEQTLLALCASQNGVGGLLPEQYEVSPHKYRKPGGISRHYIGCVRDRFYSEGILELHKQLNLSHG
jgi:hypothetical protein